MNAWQAASGKRACEDFTVTAIPVLDVGGSHVTAALVDASSWHALEGSRHRMSLQAGGTAAEIVGRVAACAQTLGSLRGTTLSIAMPGPFDYEAGIGRFEGVGKFDALNGVNVRTALSDALPEPPDGIVFLNDAVAFGLGEWIAGAAQGRARSVAITLGTGVGSAFIDAGVAVSSGPLVPPGGYVHLLSIDGRPLEDVMSTRAIVSAYQRHTEQHRAAKDLPPRNVEARETGAGEIGVREIGVREIAARAEQGEPAALRSLSDGCRALGAALAPWLARFDAEALVVGGGIAAAWSLVEPALREGIETAARKPTGLVVLRSADAEASIEAGAAWHARRMSTR